MGYILTARNPNGRRLVIVTDAEGEPIEFQTEEEATSAASETTICKAWGYDIVDVGQ